ncbi:hypothetical protein [Lactobacillus nasalidis]|nr:hypothetical protein [Lactobacillus nasalidis]
MAAEKVFFKRDRAAEFSLASAHWWLSDFTRLFMAFFLVKNYFKANEK